LRFVGELDLATRDGAKAVIERAQARTPRFLILDLRSLEFIDSTGLHILLDADLHARRNGVGAVHVVCGRDQVRHVIDLLGLDKLMSVIEHPAEVLE
jgi:anti-sigma B factor antagonist